MPQTLLLLCSRLLTRSKTLPQNQEEPDFKIQVYYLEPVQIQRNHLVLWASDF